MPSSHLISQCQDALRARARADYMEARAWWQMHRDAIWTHVLDDTAKKSHARMLCAMACYALEDHATGWPAKLGALVDQWRADVHPDEVTQLDVRLWCWRARQLCLNASDLSLAQQTFDAVFARLAQPFAQDAPCDGMWLDLEAFAQLSHMRLLTLQGELGKAHDICTCLLDELVEQAPSQPEPLWGYIQELWHFRGILEQWSGDYDSARESLYTAHLIAHEHSGWQLAATTQAMLAQLHHLEGDLELAQRTYQEVDQLALTHGLTEQEAFPIFVRVLRPFLWLELDDATQAKRLAQQLVDELTQTNAQLPLQLARSILIMSAHACEHGVIARAHHHILAIDLTHRSGPLAPLGEMLTWLWEPEAMPCSTLVSHPMADKNLFLRFAERALGHLLGKLPTRRAIRYQIDGFWLEPEGESGPRHALQRKHTARRALLSLIEAGAPGLARGALIAHIWPDEHIAHSAALTRLRVLMHQLRGLGLREVVLTTEHGYRLDQSIPFIAVH